MCHVSKCYQKYKNFADYSIVTYDVCVKFEHNSLIGLEVVFCLHWFFYVKSRFVILICKFDEEIALRIKSNFLRVHTNKILINIRAKVHLDSFIHLKVIYLGLQQNMIIALHKPLYYTNYALFCFFVSGHIQDQNFCRWLSNTYSIFKKRHAIDTRILKFIVVAFLWYRDSSLAALISWVAVVNVIFLCIEKLIV